MTPTTAISAKQCSHCDGYGRLLCYQEEWEDEQGFPQVGTYYEKVGTAPVSSDVHECDCPACRGKGTRDE